MINDNQDFSQRQMYKATCAECGNECEVPFKPSGDRPVYCSACYKSKRPSRGNYSSGPRQMYDVVCSECGQKTQVPFEPRGDKPVYCKECFMKKRGR